MTTIKGQVIAYVRVSSIDQNPERQIEAIEKHSKIDKMFIEKVSGKNIEDRAELVKMLDFIREGDTVIVKDFSRLARNTKDLLELVEILEDKKVKLISLKEQVDTSSAMGKFMLTILGGIAELERTTIRERQAEGIEIAKRKGKYKGKKAVKITGEFKELYSKYTAREINKTQFAEAYNVSRPTLNRLIKEYTEAN